MSTIICGPDRIRTGDLLVANEALYQLSYGPLNEKILWAHQGLNLGPLSYQDSVLPLNYVPNQYSKLAN